MLLLTYSTMKNMKLGVRSGPTGAERFNSRPATAELTWLGKAPSEDSPLVGVPSREKVDSLLKHELIRGTSPASFLIHGDAQEALSHLASAPASFSVAGKVKLCYIDPPYNTGERFTHYSDRSTRERWLSNFHSHLLELRNLIAHDGSVWVHLDDSEQHRARCVLDEVFGEEAFVATIIWQKRTSRESRTAFSSMHDYIHVYSPAGARKWKRVRNGLPDYGAFSNPDNDPRGPWRSTPMTVQAGHATAAQFYSLTTPTGHVHEPPPGRCWTYSRARFEELDADGRVYWPRSGAGKPRLKRFQQEATSLSPFTIWGVDEVGSTSSAKKELLREFAGIPSFDTPKPLSLMERIVQIATDPDELVLDYYLGSGTTAVAAQRLGRRWIGVERNAETITSFARPRLLRAWDSHPGFGISDIHL